jgi:hypothetical protein
MIKKKKPAKPSAMTTAFGLMQASSLFYPVMLTQESQEISESRAAELLGMSIEKYRDMKEQAIEAVMRLVRDIPSPLASVFDVLAKRPDLLVDEWQ